MRGVLCLFEGVVTGAADGYARVAGRPAATCCTSGPGSGNGLANLHNARRARTPDRQHRGRPRHLPHALRRPARVGHRVDRRRRVGLVPLVGPGRRRGRRRSRRRGGRLRARPAAWPPWSCRPTSRGPRAPPGRARHARAARPATVPVDTVEEVAQALRSGERAALLLGGTSLKSAGPARRGPGRRGDRGRAAGRDLPRRLERGAGHPRLERLAYLAEMAQAQLDGVRHLVLVDAKSPGVLLRLSRQGERPGARRLHGALLARPGEDAPGALEALAEAVGAAGGAGRRHRGRPGRPRHRRVPSTRESLAARPSGPRCPKGPSWSTRATPRVSSWPAATAGRAAPRLAHAHRWRHRHGLAGGHGRRGGRAGGRRGAVPAGRRQRHVHPPGAVDPSPRGART